MTKRNMSAVITHEQLLSLLDYDQMTGEFTWKARDYRRAYFANKKPGTVAPNGRVYIGLGGRPYLAHRLAWFYVTGNWPVHNISPKDGDYLNLRFSNLLHETPAETSRKAEARHADDGGVRGVSWDKEKDAWFAKITVNYKQISLGRFKTKAAAIRARRYAERTMLKPGEVDHERMAEKREGYRAAGAYRRLWKRTLEGAGGVTGWVSIEQFIAEIAAHGGVQDNCALEAADAATKIGPGNWQWQAKRHNQRTISGRSAYDKAYREANPHAARDGNLRRLFGISLEDYQSMLVAQNGVCACCGEPETTVHNGKLRQLAVDHCHATGAVRDLLCTGCNQGIGNFRDDPARLEKAASYLRRHAERLTAESNVVPLKPRSSG